MQALNTKVKEYESGNYIITIIESGNMFESWIRHKDYGVSDLMFGIEINGIKNALSYFIELVTNSLSEYIETYTKLHMT